jgi:hypothetical protein
LQSQADAQRGSVDDVQRRYVDYIFNGFRDKAGNFAVFDGKTWKGLRDDERVAQIDLGLPALTSISPLAQQRLRLSAPGQSRCVIKCVA